MNNSIPEPIKAGRGKSMRFLDDVGKFPLSLIISSLVAAAFGFRDNRFRARKSFYYYLKEN